MPPSKVTEWKDNFLTHAEQAFDRPADTRKEMKLKPENDHLLKKVDQMTIDCVFCNSLRGCLSKSKIAELEKNRHIGMSRNNFCKLMHLSRNNFYYKPKGESAENLQIMELMDRYDIEHTTSGVLTMVNMLSLHDITAYPKRLRRLLRKIGILAIFPKKCLSKRGKPQYIHPNLLRGMTITRPSQMWSMDISYIPMKNGFM